MIYYFQSVKERVYMIAAYLKSDVADLTPGDKRAIRKLVQELKREE